MHRKVNLLVALESFQYLDSIIICIWPFSTKLFPCIILVTLDEIVVEAIDAMKWIVDYAVQHNSRYDRVFRIIISSLVDDF